jgi:hypothetical protein
LPALLGVGPADALFSISFCQGCSVLNLSHFDGSGARGFARIGIDTNALPVNKSGIDII